MRHLQKRYGLQDYEILAYSIQEKQLHPVICFICKKDSRTLFIKKPFDNDRRTGEVIRKEYSIFKERYYDILKPEMLDRSTLSTRYIDTPSLSYHLELSFRKDSYAEKAIRWLASFHDEKHKDGFGHIQGDFSPHDIMIYKGQVVVFDWENYEDGKDQLVDIIYFIWRNSFRNTILSPKRISIPRFVSLILDEPHPYLKMYMRMRPIEFSRKRRLSGLKEFLNQRIRREDSAYLIPRRDRFQYRKVQEYLKIF